jgi:dUTP pyrophosphatase
MKITSLSAPWRFREYLKKCALSAADVLEYCGDEAEKAPRVKLICRSGPALKKILMKLAIEKIHKDSQLPAVSYAGDAGIDLFSYSDFTLKPGERVSVPTGIKMAIPEGYAGLVWDKSGLAFKRGIKSMGGVVDAGYRGEILVCLVNLSQEVQEINKGDKIAQMLIQPFVSAEIEEGILDADTIRGERGFGSSGK